jgi:SAM-dependent methyltransferase
MIGYNTTAVSPPYPQEKNMSSSFPAIDLSRILLAQEKPQPFEPGEPQFWTDPHIASQMLSFHLDPTLDAASRRPETIDRITNWIVTSVGLQPGDQILDLGCGPGLYAQRLAQAGFQVTGVDFSQNSIDYALSQAREKQLPIQYRCQSYLELDEPALYSAVLLIYGDFCPLSPQQRAKLLANVRRALKPNGCFILDVTTPHLRQKDGLKNGWYAAGQGFWKPGPHLVLEQGFAYPNDLFLDQYIVIEDDGKINVYRNWFQDYTPETIRAELSAAGFEVESLWNDLAGTPYTPDSDWIGIVARTKASGSS